ncbi:hypothetical protein HMJ29_00770 [Hymenobacter taeanensis]|uniref:Zinc-ribbon domain-containing protein n=1 Tax=Hymenobacter taeanensis TaxID=2735321 RepID=A0A6M6BCL2_9BACT|nr:MULTISPECIES: hypothetical protein [Hymenobacter]QJX45548.1 hypothetical protein HMJ29_00770 [Hymenobacter taeanensis]UOQ81203.1 hypothetical protein MUN83_20750 [Hymenobacter sp. 5414T-23]
MIIYGHRASHLTTEAVSGSCPSCATPDSRRVSVFGRYAHVYWIPLFPLGKTGIAECGHCRLVVQDKEMDADLKQTTHEVKQRVKAPIWHFSGLLLLAVLVIWGVITHNQSQKNTQTFIQAPHPGDLYHIRTENGHYSLLKVQDVTGNSVKLLPNNYEMESQTEVTKLNKPENYAAEPVELTRYDLRIMLTKEEILEVERP